MSLPGGSGGFLAAVFLWTMRSTAKRFPHPPTLQPTEPRQYNPGVRGPEGPVAVHPLMTQTGLHP